MTSVLGRRDKAQSTGYNACMLKTCRKRQGHCTRNLLANREKVHELREQPSLLVIQSTSWFPCNSHPCLPSSLMDKFGLYFSFFFSNLEPSQSQAWQEEKVDFHSHIISASISQFPQVTKHIIKQETNIPLLFGCQPSFNASSWIYADANSTLTCWIWLHQFTSSPVVTQW